MESFIREMINRQEKVIKSFAKRAYDIFSKLRVIKLTNDLHLVIVSCELKGKRVIVHLEPLVLIQKGGDRQPKD